MINNYSADSIKPFDVVGFLHLHTNETHSFSEISKNKYIIEIGAKIRPMLVLRKHYDKKQSKYIYDLLKMSGNEHREEDNIKLSDNSYLYIRNVYSYNETMIQYNNRRSLYRKLKDINYLNKIKIKHPWLLDNAVQELEYALWKNNN